MKKNFLTMLFLSLAFAAFADISLISYKGYVQLKTGETAEWFAPQSGQKLKPGFIIYTGFNSSAVIQSDGSKIEVKPLSQMSISNLISTENKISTDVYLKYGKVNAEVTPAKDIQTIFKVRSANSTASVRGTVFSFGNDTLTVEKGLVLLQSDDGFSMLLQDDETAYSPKMDFIVSPVDYKEGQAYVSILPAGMSDLELGNLGGFGDMKSVGIAKVIIRINVIK